MNFRRVLPLIAVAIAAIGFIVPSCDKLVTETNNITYYDSTLGLECSRCHSDDNNRYLRPTAQWQNSRHASDDLIKTTIDLNGEPREVAKCGPQCHTHEGYLKFVTDGRIVQQTAPNVIGCFTCHTPHTGDFGTWSDTTLRGWQDFIYLAGGGVYMQGLSNMCAQCHHARNVSPSDTISGVTLTADWGPHSSCQADVLVGKIGHSFEGVSVLPSHDSIDNGCLGCHFGKGLGYEFGEHTFRLGDSITGEQYLANCNVGGACHGSSQLALLGSHHEFTTYDSIPIFADSLEALLKAWGYIDSTDQAGIRFPAGSTVETDVALILYNYLLYKLDGSRGVHNPALMEQLLRESVARWDSVQPSAAFTVSDTVGCAPLDVTFADMSQTLLGVLDWSWVFGDGGTSDERNPSHLYTQPGDYSVTLTVTDANGIDSLTKTGYIRVNGPDAAIGVDSTVGYAPLTVTFTNESDCDSAATLLWDFGDGTTSDQDTVTHVFETVDTFTVILTIENQYGTSAVAEVVIATGPKAAFSSGSTFGFAPLMVEFIDLSQPQDSITEWYWDFGDGNTSTEPAPTHTYNIPDTTYTVTLIVTSNYGKDTVVAEDYIRIYGPMAFFSADTDSGCVPLTVQFTNRSLDTSHIESVLWDFGDSTTSTAVHPDPHTYDSVGLYTVSLTVYSLYGENTETKMGYINAMGPQALFEMDQEVLCAMSEISFTNLSTCSPDSVRWYFDDTTGADSTSTLTDPTHTYDTTGTYEIFLAVYNQYGADTLKHTVTVYGPEAGFDASPTTGCAPLDVQFTNVNEHGCDITEWRWSFGDGDTVTVDLPTVAHMYEIPGQYKVILVVTGPGGTDRVVSADDFIEVTGPVADFTSDADSICLTDTVTFTAETPGCEVSEWFWSFGDGTDTTTDEQVPVSHVYADSGVYTVALTVEDSLGNSTEANKDSLITVIEGIPTAKFGVSDVSGPAPLVVSFTDSSLNANQWSWQFGDGDVSVQRNPKHTYDSASVYDVVLTVSNACGDDSYIISINVTEPQK